MGVKDDIKMEEMSIFLCLEKRVSMKGEVEDKRDN